MPFIIPARNPKTPEGIDDHGHLEIDLVSISGEMSFEELWGRYASGCLEYAFSRDTNACPHICDQSYQTWMNNFSTLPESRFRDFMLHFIHQEYFDFYISQWNPVLPLLPQGFQHLSICFRESDFFAKSR